MSGHNKWSTSKHKQGAADARRSKLFTIPKNIKNAAGPGAEVLLSLLEAPEDHEDVQKVYSYLELSEEDLKRLAQ